MWMTLNTRTVCNQENSLNEDHLCILITASDEISFIEWYIIGHRFSIGLHLLKQKTLQKWRYSPSIEFMTRETKEKILTISEWCKWLEVTYNSLWKKAVASEANDFFKQAFAIILRLQQTDCFYIFIYTTIQQVKAHIHKV